MTCISDADKDKYGSVDLELLTELTWYPIGDKSFAGKIFPLGENKPTYYHWRWYNCSTNECDTCYRSDTSSEITSLIISEDTVEFVEYVWPPKTAKITKLTQEELIMKYIDASSDIFKEYERNHKTLVTKGTGENEGNDTVDYQE